ncbi:hypothetical protein ACFQ0B_44905 [Nonomuraea thailandensis]
MVEDPLLTDPSSSEPNAPRPWEPTISRSHAVPVRASTGCAFWTSSTSSTSGCLASHGATRSRTISCRVAWISSTSK